MRMARTNREKPLVVLDGYEHRLVGSPTDETCLHYRCVKKFCKGRIHMDMAGGNAVIVTEHVHEPDYFESEKLERRNELKRLASSSNDPPREIINRRRSIDSDEMITVGPSVMADQRLIERARVHKGAAMVDRTVMSEIRIEGPYAQTKRDFEKASERAIRMTWPDANINFCLFHLSQATYRKAVHLGLKPHFSNPDIRRAVRCLPSLAFLLPEYVKQGFDNLSAVAPDDTRELYQCFGSVYIGATDTEENVTRAPMYPIETWNVHARTLYGEARTNNGVEAWHTSVNVSAGNHPRLSKLFDVLQNEENAVRARLCHRESHPNEPFQLRPPRKDYQRKDRLLKQMCTRFDIREDPNLLQFFRSASHYIRME